MNLGLNYYVPEAFFMRKPAPILPTVFEFNPKLISFEAPLVEPEGEILPVRNSIGKQEQELIVFVGSPASGKSTFFKRYFEPHGYYHVNQDILR